MKKRLCMFILSAFLFNLCENTGFYKAWDTSENILNMNSLYVAVSQEAEEYLSKDQNLGIKLVGNKSSYKEKLSFLGYDNMTTEAQRTFYQKIKNGITKITDKKNTDGFYDIEPIVLRGYKLESGEIKKVIYAFQNDNPEVFWLASRYYITYRGTDTILKISSVMKKGEYEESLKKLNSQVDKILKSVPEGLSEYKRELFVHDYIIENCEYDKANYSQKPWEKYTCLGCLVSKRAVCEGYSKATQLLLMRLGVRCRTITGSRGQEHHMWNMVNIGGDWYHLDVTWDNKESLNRYSYFNVTDGVIRKDHKVNEEISKMTNLNFYEKNYNFSLPICNSNKYNYFMLNSLYVTSATTNENIVTYMKKTAKKGGKIFYFMIDPKINLNSVIKMFFQAPEYKFFNCIRKVNESLDSKTRFNTKNLRYGENKNQRVISVEVEYV